MKNEINVTCNNGTKFKIKWDSKNRCYILSYRNDTVPLRCPTGNSFKGKWLFLDTQDNYSDVLDFMFDEIRAIEAKEGE